MIKESFHSKQLCTHIGKSYMPIRKLNSAHILEMDAIELLARENEYKRLNKQLEKKTESLMREIEHVMQKQDFFAVFSPSLTQSHVKIKKHCCTPPSEPVTPIKRPIRKSLNSEPQTTESNSEFESESPSSCLIKNKTDKNKAQKRVVCDCCPIVKSDDLEFLHAFVSVNVKDKVLPPSFSKDRISVESVCKFLSSKIKLMQEQIDKLQTVIDRKASQCESHMTQIAEYESERLTLLNRSNSMKCSTADMRAKYAALQKRLEEKDRLYKEQRSETDKLSSELKRVATRVATAEAKCSSQEHVIDTLKQQLEVSKRSEKEFRDSSRSLSASHQSAISRLESQIKTLTSRTDKQRSLIDNLRKQNLLLATDGAVKCLERDYCNFLNEDP